jgi:hypothetical protein
MNTQCITKDIVSLKIRKKLHLEGIEFKNCANLENLFPPTKWQKFGDLLENRNTTLPPNFC